MCVLQAMHSGVILENRNAGDIDRKLEAYEQLLLTSENVTLRGEDMKAFSVPTAPGRSGGPGSRRGSWTGGFTAGACSGQRRSCRTWAMSTSSCSTRRPGGDRQMGRVENRDARHETCFHMCVACLLWGSQRRI